MNQRFIRFILVLLFLGIILHTYCNLHLGRLVDKKKSESYFYSFNSIAYCPNGNWLEVASPVKCKADLSSFKVLSENIAKDRNSVFYKGIIVKGTDSKSFRIENAIPRDKSFAYIEEYDSLKPIKGIDAASFQYLDIHGVNPQVWSKDNRNYYLNYKKVNVDYPSFTILDSGYAKDKDSFYSFLYGDDFFSINANPQHTRILNSRNVRDQNTLYSIQKLEKIEIVKTKLNPTDSVEIISQYSTRIVKKNSK